MKHRSLKIISSAVASVVLMAVFGVTSALASLTVATEPATNIGTATVTLHATISSSALETRANFAYGVKGGSLDHYTPVQHLEAGTHGISAVVSVEPGTAYEFKADALSFSPSAAVEGKTLGFTSEALRPASFEAGSYPATASGAQNASEDFAFGGTTVQCTTGSLSKGSLSAAAQSITLTPQYSGCEGGGVSVEVKANTCQYTLALNSSGPPYTAGLGVTCSKEGDAIEARLYSGAETLCTAKIPAQSASGSLSAATEGEAGTRKAHVTGTAKAIHYTSSGAFCEIAGIPKSGTTGHVGIDSALGATYLG